MQLDDVVRDLGWAGLVRIVVRLGIATVLGAAVGWEREVHHRWAGLRTHVLVTLGTASFMLLATELGDRGKSDPLRVMQGVVAGIGFLGGGAILKLQDERRVEGLTTASGIWVAAAIGLAVGAGFVVLGALLTGLALVILWLLRVVERRAGRSEAEERSD